MKRHGSSRKIGKHLSSHRLKRRICGRNLKESTNVS